MTRFEWRQDYETGNTLIDSQHRQLLRLANLFYEAMVADRDTDALDKAFEALFLYTTKHFSDEEAFYTSIATPLLEEHRIEHGILIDELNKYYKDRLAGDVTVSYHLEKWVEKYLVPHMIEADQAALGAAPANPDP